MPWSIACCLLPTTGGCPPPTHTSKSQRLIDTTHFVEQLPARGAGAQRALVHQGPDALHRLGDGEQTLHAGEIDTQLVHEMLDQTELFQLFTRVQTHAAERPRRLNQSQAFVLA